MSPSPAAVDSDSQRHDPWAALRGSPFRWFFCGNLCFLFGLQLQSATIAWELYKRTGNLLDLANIGLVKVIPVILLAIPVGQLADRWDRRKVILLSLSLFLSTSLILVYISWTAGSVNGIFCCLFAQGVAQVLQQPAKASLLPKLVPRNQFANAVSWSTTGFQISQVSGPAVAGVVIGLLGPNWSYLISAFFTVLFAVAIVRIPRQAPAENSQRVTLRSLFAGAAFLYTNRLLLAAISLDMLAVLLGGSMALLPVYAKDILHAGPTAYGWLGAAPGIGALLMSFVLTALPPMRRSGLALLSAVALFGLATIGFGFSRSVSISWLLLFLTGTFDMVSVVIRHTLIQLWTPDGMRGRVSAINGVFISVSNELGGFESAVVAHLFQRQGSPEFGPTLSVVVGGVGTLLVVSAVALLFPELRRHGRLDQGPRDAT